MDSGKATESQGQRLSTYASSSSYNPDSTGSPKTPKKSSVAAATPADKLLSSRSNSREDPVSPHHIISDYNSYSSISSFSTKGGHTECALKCTCKHSSFSSLRSPKQHSHGPPGQSAFPYDKQIQKISKISCDAATSPNRFNQRSPQANLRTTGNDASKKSNELRISDEKTITAKTTASPRRLIATRNAATSPGLDKRKLNPKCEVQPKPVEVAIKSVLEKANSLGDSKPARTLRTTRSLSPRPPVRHQHAITVCDENDRVSVKISPNEDFEEEIGEGRFAKMRYKAQSEQTSPNLSDLGTKFSYETRSNNKSTGCLVYVPSDPWMKMPDVENAGKTEKKKHGKLASEARSLSRGNLLPLNDDPWIWRSNNKTAAVKPKSPKQEAFRQAKSFSATKFELNDLSKSVEKNGPTGKNSTRPKLQRCKSPIVIEDEFPSDPPRTCTCNAVPIAGLDGSKQQENLLSPRKESVNKEVAVASKNKLNFTTIATVPSTKNFLNVTNSNLMQSRHSFSSISQKDDELQLNIRRLSEQIKNPIQGSTGTVSVGSGGGVVGGGGADFTDYLNQFRTVEAKKAKAAAAAATAATRNVTKGVPDAVLETTC